MDEQRQVATFVERHDLHAPPAYRALDLVSEVGEVGKEINLSTGYGDHDDVAIATDEIGDCLFALLSLAEAVGVDAGEALEEAIGKYEARLEGTGDAGSS